MPISLGGDANDSRIAVVIRVTLILVAVTAGLGALIEAGTGLGRHLLQSGEDPVELETHSIGALVLRAPPGFREHPLSEEFAEQVESAPAIAALHKYRWWEEGPRVVLAYHMDLASHSSLDLDTTVRALIEAVTPTLAAEWELSQGPVYPKDTTVSDSPARVARTVLEGQDKRILVRGIATQTDRDVWCVMALGVSGPRTEMLVDSVLTSLTFPQPVLPDEATNEDQTRLK